MKRIISSYIEYNANSNNRHTSDCSIRAISLALKEPYDSVKHDLYTLGRKMGRAYKEVSTINTYLHSYGYERKEVAELMESYRIPSVAEFAYQFPTGTFIIACGKSDRISHLVTVIDGDIFDSWDSSNYKVIWVWVIEEGESKQLSDEPDISKLADEFSAVLSRFIATYAKKMPYAEITFREKPSSRTADSCVFEIGLDIQDCHPLYDGTHAVLRLPVKINPRSSLESQMKKVIEFKRVEVREWLYSWKSEIDQMLKYSIKKNPYFQGNRDLLAKLSESMIPHVTSALINSPYSPEYEVTIKDYVNNSDGYLLFAEDNVRTLLAALRKYEKTGQGGDPV